MRNPPVTIPSVPVASPDHFSTWWAQEQDQPKNAQIIDKLSAIRDNLTHERLFGADGWAKTLYPSVRQDLYFTICDGWELPATQGGRRLLETDRFGSQILDAGKFPLYGDTPRERLKTYATLTREAGWKGAGLWICAQEDTASRKGNDFDPDFWRERLEWSAYAGIEYWEVDWGRHCADVRFRRFLTDTARTICPHLTVEHIVGCGGLNDELQSGRMPPELLQKCCETAAFSDVFRTYDITQQLSVATTFDRVAALLKNAAPPQDGTRGLICCEDQVALSAALGLTAMVMRHPAKQHSIDEVSRAQRFKRLAPAFSGGAVQVSVEVLCDAWHFDGDTWYAPVDGKTVRQYAPAVIARGDLALPEVRCTGEKPYVAAALHPNGCMSLCSLPRTLNGTQCDETPCRNAEITLRPGAAWNGVLAVFGYVKTLCIVLPESVKKLTLYAQDLLEATPHILQNGWTLRDGCIYLDGEPLEKTGLACAARADTSAPGVLLSFIKEDSI